ncbi:hypothetical protein L1887_29083 [Cichorium endivia]|nr:hypothetical protein L1887_29083 [Cichorium endivia]
MMSSVEDVTRSTKKEEMSVKNKFIELVLCSWKRSAECTVPSELIHHYLFVNGILVPSGSRVVPFGFVGVFGLCDERFFREVAAMWNILGGNCGFVATMAAGKIFDCNMEHKSCIVSVLIEFGGWSVIVNIGSAAFGFKSEKKTRFELKSEMNVIKQLQSRLTPRYLLHKFLKHIMVSESWFHSIWKPSKNHDHGPEKARIGVLVFEVASVMSKLVQSRTVHFFDESYDI